MEQDYHKTLILDIETTGLIPNIMVAGKRKGTTRKEQVPYATGFDKYPHIVSISWKIDDEETREFVLNQEGREVPVEASDINGITTAIANKSEHIFHKIFMSLMMECSEIEIVVGHGLYFDTSIIKANVLREVEKGRIEKADYEYFCEIVHKHKRIDTMRSTAKLMKKWPTLSELHFKIFRKGFAAHNCKNDVDATYRCYNWLLKKGIVPTWEELQEKSEK